MELLDAFAKLLQETISFVTCFCLPACLSVHTEQLRSFWTDFNWIWCLRISPKSVKFQVSLKYDKKSGYFTRIRSYVYNNVSFSSSYNAKCFRQKSWRKSEIKFCVKKIFYPKNLAIFKIVWKNIVERGRPHMTIWRMRFACWVTKATNTYSEYVNTCCFFSLQKWFRERASL